jgi:hypothetical protein
MLNPRWNLMEDFVIWMIPISNTWVYTYVGAQRAEGIYMVKGAIRFHSPEHPNVCNAKYSIYFVILWNGLNLLEARVCGFHFGNYKKGDIRGGSQLFQ